MAQRTLLRLSTAGIRTWIAKSCPPINFRYVDTDTEEALKVFGDSDERYRIKGGNSSTIEGLIKIGGDKIEKKHEGEATFENKWR